MYESENKTLSEALVEAVLKGANLRGADLQGAYLRGANLQGANLRGADLRGADLRGADLQGAYLRGADLRGADLQGADLQGAYLQDGIKINLAPIQVSTSRYQVTVWDRHMQIGCKFHSIEDWFGFDNRAIAEMDGKKALEFWAKWKPALIEICKAEGRS